MEGDHEIYQRINGYNRRRTNRRPFYDRSGNPSCLRRILRLHLVALACVQWLVAIAFVGLVIALLTWAGVNVALVLQELFS